MTTPITKKLSATDTMKRKKRHVLALWLWITDVVLIIAAYGAAYAIRFAPGMPVVHGTPPFDLYIRIMPFVILVYLLVLRFYGLYKPTRLTSTLEEFFLILKSVFIGSVILMAGSFVYREYTYSRIMLIISGILLVTFLFVNRVIYHYFEAKLAKVKGFQKNILLVGHGHVMRQILRGLQGFRKGAFAVAGILTSEKEHVGTHINQVSVIGTLDDFEKIISEYPVDEVILGETEVPRTQILKMILKCEERMIHFKMVSDMLGLVTTKVDIENINGVSLLGMKETPLNHPANRFIKRLMDVSISSFSIIVLSPILLILSILIKITDKGPILYKQERVGEDGKIFNIYKFRSMKVDAEAASGPKFADEDDPRKTPLGDFLRRTNLDEIPQFFNVLKGDMSLVGPRPERPVFVDQLKLDIPRYMSRHRVRSGVTGWAQVNGLRGGPPCEERIKYDLYYIENWSVWLDFKILLMTPFAFKNAK